MYIFIIIWIVKINLFINQKVFLTLYYCYLRIACVCVCVYVCVCVWVTLVYTIRFTGVFNQMCFVKGLLYTSLMIVKYDIYEYIYIYVYIRYTLFIIYYIMSVPKFISYGGNPHWNIVGFQPLLPNPLRPSCWVSGTKSSTVAPNLVGFQAQLPILVAIPSEYNMPKGTRFQTKKVGETLTAKLFFRNPVPLIRLFRICCYYYLWMLSIFIS